MSAPGWWPIAPIFQALTDRGEPETRLREYLNVNHGQWLKIIRHGHISDVHADHVAIELLGLLPVELWPDWCDEDRIVVHGQMCGQVEMFDETEVAA